MGLDLVILIGIPPVIRNTEHLFLLPFLHVVFFLFLSFKGVRKIYLFQLAS